jgi:hypothetical protein
MRLEPGEREREEKMATGSLAPNSGTNIKQARLAHVGLVRQNWPISNTPLGHVCDMDGLASPTGPGLHRPISSAATLHVCAPVPNDLGLNENMFVKKNSKYIWLPSTATW